MVHDTLRLTRDLQTVLAISRAMSSERDLGRLLDLIVAAVTDLVGADRTSLYLVDHERNELWTQVSQNTTAIRLPMGRGIAGTVATTGETINIPTAYADARFDRGNDQRSGYETRSILCMAMRNHGNQVVGVVQALNKRDGTPFNDYDEQLLSALASAGAVAIDNAQLVARDRERQRMERDMELARQIQLGLLPERPPEHPGWRIAAFAQSCDETGGDYYDFMPVAGGGLDAVVGDVSGHGIPSALLMSTARAFLRALHERGLPPGETVTALNRLLEQDLADDSFMTLVLARLADDGAMQYVAAGHEPPLVWRRDGSFDALDSSGLPVGMIDDSVYEEATVKPLAAGELIVLCTDGISEAQRPPGHLQFGQERLRALVAEHAGQGAQAVCDALVSAVSEHLDGHPPHDDITLVVIERR